MSPSIPFHHTLAGRRFKQEKARELKGALTAYVQQRVEQHQEVAAEYQALLPKLQVGRLVGACVRGVSIGRSVGRLIGQLVGWVVRPAMMVQSPSLCVCVTRSVITLQGVNVEDTSLPATVSTRAGARSGSNSNNNKAEEEVMGL